MLSLLNENEFLSGASKSLSGMRSSKFLSGVYVNFYTFWIYVPRRSVVPKTPDSKMMLLVRRTLPDKTRFTENLSVYLSPPAPNLPLQNPSNFGMTASHWLLYFLLFFFFLIFNRMDAWSLMRGDAFIHFACGSRRVNIRLGVLLLISKSPHVTVLQCVFHSSIFETRIRGPC